MDSHSASRQEEKQAKDIFEYAKEAVPLVVIIVSIIFSWAYFQFNLSSHERRLDTIEAGRAQDMESISTISGDIKAINAKLDLLINKRIN